MPSLLDKLFLWLGYIPSREYNKLQADIAGFRTLHKQILLAHKGMLQRGIAHELEKSIAEGKKNG